MKIYQEPEIEITKFDSEEILLISGGTEVDEYGNIGFDDGGDASAWQ